MGFNEKYTRISPNHNRKQLDKINTAIPCRIQIEDADGRRTQFMRVSAQALDKIIEALEAEQ